MTNDGQAQEVHATVTSSGHSREPSNGDQAQRPDVLAGEVIDDEDIDDEDALIIEEVSAAPADDEPGRDQVTSTPAATAIPDARPPGVPGGTAAGAGATAAAARTPAEITMVGDPEELHEQWAAIQSTFVDDPRGSVAAGAELVSETVAALVASAKERERGLRDEWDRDGVDTEGLRNALRSYRDLFDRLVRL
jgi:hypothetical protein